MAHLGQAEAARRSVAEGAGEAVVVDLARFRRGEMPAALHVADTPPLPVADHNLPQPNPTFVGRKAELEALHRALAATGRGAITQSRQAISGLGGIGKTQLALAYAYAHLGDYDLVRWLRAEEPSVLAADYAGLASALGISPTATSHQPALITSIRSKLEGKERWLLVFDNAGEPATLDAYLPRTGVGHVLITSRWQEWEGIASALELQTLPEAEAVALLLGDGIGDADERAAAAKLAQELGHLPLALGQARAFMRARRVGIAGYRQQLTAAQSKVLSWRPPSAAYPLAVAQAWQASLDQAVRDCPPAGELMSLLAFLAPEAVPRDLLGAKPGALPEGLRDPFDRDTAIEALGRFSLIRVEPDSLTVHRLVQAVTRERANSATVRNCVDAALVTIDAALPRPVWNDIHSPVIGRLLPHALLVCEAAEQFGIGLLTAGAILNHFGEYLSWHAAFSEAERLHLRALAISERVFDTDHPDVVGALHGLAVVYNNTLRPGGAEPLLQRALEVQERTVGPEDGSVGPLLYQLAVTYIYTGRPTKAEPLLARVLSIQERTLGPEHDFVANTLCRLADIYRDTDRLAEAELFLKRALALREQALGPEHRRLAVPLKLLANLYRDMARLADAEPLFHRCLEIVEKDPQPNPRLLKLVLNDYAALLDTFGRLDEAAECRSRADAIEQRREQR